MTDTPFHITHISDQPGYSATVMAERHLNAAILRADIREGFEEISSIAFTPTTSRPAAKDTRAPS
jgi:hypothetical protein